MNVTDVRATFRFVHVVGGDEEGHAKAGKFEEQIPQLAPRNRINAGSRFVEEQNGGVVHERTGHGQALAPAAGKERGATSEIGLEMGKRDQLFHALFERGAREAVEPAIELQVFVHGELVVEGKFLRHVANGGFEFITRFGDIDAGDGGGAIGRLQNSAKHTDDGRFAGAIRTEKSEDGTFGDGEGDMIDSRE